MTSPAPVWDVINGYAAYWALRAGLDLGVFDRLADGPCDTAALATAVGAADPGDVAALAELLAALDLLDTDGTAWSLTPAAARFLVTSSPASMTELVHHSPGPPAAWPDLARTLRAGAPDPTTVAALDALYPDLVRATSATQRAVAAGVAQTLTAQGFWGRSGQVVVDLGCGSGAWLAALLDAGGAGSRGVGVDRDPVLATVPVRPDAELRAGDYLDVELPVERADVVVLAHVLRAESRGRAAALVARALDLLTPDGVLLVADYFRPPSGQPAGVYRAARHDLTLALTMRASTSGRGVTEDDLAAWCAPLGARTVEVVEPVPRQRVHLITRGDR